MKQINMSQKIRLAINEQKFQSSSYKKKSNRN
jgi:hypothetical protein